MSEAPAPRRVDGRSSTGSPGWREVLAVAAAIVGIVLGLAVGTSILPTGIQDLVFRTPLAIIVLITGTIGLLVWLSRRPPSAA